MLKRASVADVARLAGVSTATVSRVTTAPERVSEKTREKVLAAIAELDFVKSASGLNLRQQASHNILVVVKNLGNIYWSAVFHGVHQRAESNGYSVMITNPDAAQHTGSFVDHLRAGRVDGVILLDMVDISDEDWARLEEHFGGKPPLVGFCEKRGHRKYPHVFIDNENAAYRATRYLIECGHTNIAHIHGPDTHVAAKERLTGFRRAMDEAGLEVGPDALWISEFHRDGGRRAARRIARLTELPTAVFCCTDEVAMGCISEFATLGVKVPDDVSIMGFDNNSFADVYVPALTTMAQPREQIGVATMDMLLNLLDPTKFERPETMDPGLELKVHLAKRQSVKDAT